MIKAFLSYLYFYSTINNVYIDISFGTRLLVCSENEQFMWITMTDMDTYSPHSQRRIQRVINLAELAKIELLDGDVAFKDYITNILNEMRNELKEDSDEHR